ncbi:MAG: glycosyltransferase family 2 protein [Tistlia sp.]|uniref:glycosyltransferase family 2 protein n=1 Tax=Tistlia sp. TaxID=3057121 RepID=UPI0034A583DE
MINWNAGELLRRCLASLGASPADRVLLRRLVVVDNGSSDGSTAALPEGELPLELLTPAENLGFGRGCNVGAAAGSAPYILFLNPDVEILPGAVASLVAHLEKPGNARVGLAGARTLDAAGLVQRHCARFPTPGRSLAQSLGLDRLFPRAFPPHFLSEWDHGETRAVDQVIGAFFVIRRPLFEALGGFDRRFFLYYEDVDLAKRAADAGWRSDYVAEAAVRHVGGGTTRQIPARRLGYLLASRVRYAAKHFSLLPAALVAASALILEPLVRALRGLALGRTGEVGSALTGMRLAWAELLSRPPRRG